MKHTTKHPFLTRLIQKIAKKMGAKVILEPEFGYVGQIIFRNGKRTFFRNRVLSINTVSAVEVARDKNYSSFFLKKFGYHVPREQTFFSEEFCKHIRQKRNLAAACTYARSLGFPVIIKPNTLSQGTLVTKVRNQKELQIAARKILRNHHLFLVQEYQPGRDYRIVVLDRNVISAYERVPLSIIGTGKDSVKELLQKKQEAFERNGRDTQLHMDDFRIAWKLKSQRLSLSSIVEKNRHVPLLDNANLSTGGESRDITQTMHRDYRTLAIAITKDMGLRLCGVDIMTSDIRKPLDPHHVILEINAAPGLDHYASTGKKQQKIVEKLYEKVLRAIERQ